MTLFVPYFLSEYLQTARAHFGVKVIVGKKETISAHVQCCGGSRRSRVGWWCARDWSPGPFGVLRFSESRDKLLIIRCEMTSPTYQRPRIEDCEPV